MRDDLGGGGRAWIEQSIDKFIDLFVHSGVSVCILLRIVIVSFNGLMMSWQTSPLIPGGLTVPNEYTHTHTRINSRVLEVLIENFHNFSRAAASSAHQV